MKITGFYKKDIEAVLEIEQYSFPQAWNRKSFVDELRYSGTVNLVMRNDNGGSPESVMAYLCARFMDMEIYILKLAVAEKWRGRGIASRLLEESFRLALEDKSVAALLDVRSTNHSAICLYRKHGFYTVGIRPNYYTDTGEDALVMRKSLKKEET